MGAVVDHPSAQPVRADLQGPLLDALFALAVLMNPPVGRAGDVAEASRLAARILPLVEADASAQSRLLTIGFACHAAALSDATIAADRRASVARSELACLMRDAAVDRLADARARLAALGVDTR